MSDRGLLLLMQKHVCVYVSVWNWDSVTPITIFTVLSFLVFIDVNKTCCLPRQKKGSHHSNRPPLQAHTHTHTHTHTSLGQKRKWMLDDWWRKGAFKTPCLRHMGRLPPQEAREMEGKKKTETPKGLSDRWIDWTEKREKVWNRDDYICIRECDWEKTRMWRNDTVMWRGPVLMLSNIHLPHNAVD